MPPKPPENLEVIEIAVKAAMFDFSKGISEQLQLIIDEQVATKARLADGDAVMQGLRDDLAANSKSTEEIRDAFDFAKKGLKFIGSAATWIGRLAVWGLKFGAPIGAAWVAIKGWHWPWTK